MSEHETIYMPLLDEGTDVWRPVLAKLLADGSYRILGPVPDEEVWAFRPGTIVRVQVRAFSDGTTALVAVQSPPRPRPAPCEPAGKAVDSPA